MWKMQGGICGERLPLCEKWRRKCVVSDYHYVENAGGGGGDMWCVITIM